MATGEDLPQLTGPVVSLQAAQCLHLSIIMITDNDMVGFGGSPINSCKSEAASKFVPRC